MTVIPMGRTLPCASSYLTIGDAVTAAHLLPQSYRLQAKVQMNAIEHDIEIFKRLVPLGDEASMVMKAHLILEESLWKFLAARLPEELVVTFSDEQSPVNNGKALVQLAQAVASRDEIPISQDEVVWAALYKISKLRNKLAHELDPQRKKVVSLMKDVCRLVLRIDDTVEPMRDFYLATLLLVQYLAIDREPLTLADVDME